MLSLRFLAMPAIALAVIVALAQVHARSEAGQNQTVYRAVNCATSGTGPTCTLARNTETSVVR